MAAMVVQCVLFVLLAAGGQAAIERCTFNSYREFSCTGLKKGSDVQTWLMKLVTPSSSLRFTVKFDNCDFSETDDGASNWFKGYSYVTQFQCDDCIIKTFPLPFFKYFGAYLTRINIYWSTIETITGEGALSLAFRTSMTTLEFYNVQGESHDKPITVKTNAFAYYSSLQNLYFHGLVGTVAPIFEPNAFANIPSLRNLYLDGAKINKLTVDVFTGLPALYYLNLANNNLTSLPEDIFHKSEQPLLNKLDLKENDWDCRCDAKQKWLQVYISQNRIQLDAMQCTIPIIKSFVSFPFSVCSSPVAAKQLLSEARVEHFSWLIGTEAEK